MANFLKFRGPDRVGMWAGESVGFAHTLLATTFEAETEQQPFTLDGNVYITADCRIDARDELKAALASHGRTDVKNANDAELILHAYHVWGEDCVDHLLGDFSFAIWDAPKRRLFCARDQSGIKQFYYAEKSGRFIFSNTLNCVRLHPAVSDKFDDLVMLDFLMMGANKDIASTTIFADIRSLPPAHTLTWEAAQLRIRRYWQRPIDEPIRFRRSRDYVDRFVELLDDAIRDRLRTRKADVQMSGGLDSTLIAARILKVAGKDFDLHAHCIYFSTLIPDQERHYAELAARHLGIPIHLLCADGYEPYQGGSGAATPEPEDLTRYAMHLDYRRPMAAHSRVNFYGEGPDNLLKYEWRIYLDYLREQGRYGHIMGDLTRSFLLDPRLPLNFARRRKALSSFWNPASFPEWLRPEMVDRYGLRERWTKSWTPERGAHPYHPAAYGSMSISNWLANFNSADPGVTGEHMETRNPFLDLRLARYLLAVPVIPWCRRKLLVRHASRDVLPKEIWNREKTPLVGDPQEALHQKGKFQGCSWPPLADFANYVMDWPAINASTSWSLLLSTFPISLGFWWQSQKTRRPES